MNRIVALASLAVVAVTEGVTVEVASAGTVEGTVVVSGGAEVRPINQPPRRYRRRPGPRLMAPLRIDLGGMLAASDYGTLGGAEASIGIHWASLSPTPTNFDVGIGVFGGALTSSQLPDDANGDPQDVTYGGLYLEGGKTLSQGTFWRTWALGRGEYLASDGPGDAGATEHHVGIGASAKLEAELYLSGVGVSPDGIFLGTYALGVYVEGGVRRLNSKVSDLQLGLGLTIRTPMVWTWW